MQQIVPGEVGGARSHEYRTRRHVGCWFPPGILGMTSLKGRSGGRTKDFRQ